MVGHWHGMHFTVAITSQQERWLSVTCPLQQVLLVSMSPLILELLLLPRQITNL